jgi:hypothetical protein
MYLETCRPPKSLPAAPLEELLLRQEAARKDLAVHVSLSSDSLVKQPGTVGDPTPQINEEPSKFSSTRPRPEALSPNISEELRRHAIAPSGGAPVGGLYDPSLSIVNTAVQDFGALIGPVGIYIARFAISQLSHFEPHPVTPY